MPKFLFTGLVIVVIFYGFRWFTRMQERRDRNIRQRGNGTKPQGTATGSSAKSDNADIETMVECKVCGSYVASGSARSCGRENCPYMG